VINRPCKSLYILRIYGKMMKKKLLYEKWFENDRYVSSAEVQIGKTADSWYNILRFPSCSG
jgi:hypothetical protein